MANTSLSTYLSDRKEMRLNSGLGDQISVRSFNVIMCAVLAYGFVVNALMVYFFGDSVVMFFQKASWWVLLLAYMLPTFAGILIAARSDNPVISFLGYNLVVLPIGLLLSALLPMFPVQIVIKAMLLTGMVVATMTVLAVVNPSFFLGLWRTLFVALIVGLVAEVVATFLLGYIGTLFDWIFVLIFSGYIGFDVAKSQAFPKTVDNAVDSALDIYIDIINLFIRILSILGRRN
ncbi:MAG: US12 family protein [Bacteroidales bacterium]|nr:US12 family protein [Bacteroidales bacterium]